MDRYITIKLIRSELIYEINLSAYAVGETIRGEDDDRSLVMDICDDGKADKTTQTLNKAWGDLLNDMTGYTKIETDEDMDVDNTFVSPEEYTARN